MVATQRVHDQLAPRLLRFLSPPDLPPSQFGTPTFLHRSLSSSESPPPDRSTPILPRISSLLTPRRDKQFPQQQDTPAQRVETNSRKRSREIQPKLQERGRFEGHREADNWTTLSPPTGFSSSGSGPKVASIRRVMYPDSGLMQCAAPEAHGAVSPTEVANRASPTFLGHLTPQRYQQTERVTTISRGDVERCRVYFNHKTLENDAPTEVPVVSNQSFFSGAARKQQNTSRYHRLRMEPVDTQQTIYGDGDGMEAVSQKRRRIVTPSPTPQLSQPLYDREYGLVEVETPKAPMCLQYPVGMQSTMDGDISTPRQYYSLSCAQDSGNANSPHEAQPRPSYSDVGHTPATSIMSTPGVRAAPASPRIQSSVEKHEPPSLTTMILKSKEFLKSKSLVRNRHDEIDWVATFLNVGFDPSSIYALMCPLRKGRWKVEEENYTMGLLRLIESGTILLRHGQSIRGYIGEKLHSDDMRVLKKLSNCKMFHFAKLINPRLAEVERLDMSVEGAQEGLDQLEQLKGEFLRSVQLEALVAVRKYLSDSSLRNLLNVRE